MSVAADITRPIADHQAGIAFLRRQGSGRKVVLLHGIGSNAATFAPLIDRLPATLDIVAWNAPGYGGSQPVTSSRPHPSEYADALLKLLDALSFDKVTLLGHSLGCLFAGNLAARYPDRVTSLALLSPALGYRVAPGEAMPPTVQDRIDEIKALGPKDFAAKRAARLIYQPDTKPAVLNGVREAMGAVDPAGYAQAAGALGSGDLMADAPKITAKTLVAVGAQDVVTPPANARKLYDVLTQPAGYHEIADTGHAFPQENPAAVARLLTDLIEAHHA